MVHSGKDYFDQLERLINNAEHEIHLQTYIFDNDQTGTRIANALIAAAKRKVNVYVVVDAYGSKKLGKLATQMMENKVQLRYFGQVYTGKNGAWGRRLHHKIVVADRSKALVGGINIADKYHGIEKETAWLDYALLIEGAVCKEMVKVCRQVYEKMYLPKRRMLKTFEKTGVGKIPIQLRQNDWLRGKNQVARSYIKAIKSAKTEILIANSYFMPGRAFRNALKSSIKKGVKIKMLLPGISDIPFAKQATEYLYGYLIRNGIEIYEWQPSVLHAKIACIDGQWCTVGSYNLNYLSAYASIEFNINVLDSKFCSNFQSQLNTLLSNHCEKVISKRYLKKRSLFSKFCLWAAYRLVRISEALLTTFPGQRLFNTNRYA